MNLDDLSVSNNLIRRICWRRSMGCLHSSNKRGSSGSRCPCTKWDPKFHTRDNHGHGGLCDWRRPTGSVGGFAGLIPVVVNRDYGYPGFRGRRRDAGDRFVPLGEHGRDPGHVCIVFENGCTSIAITTGGALAKTAAANDATAWIFKHGAAVGGHWILVWVAAGPVHEAELTPVPSPELAEAQQAMLKLQSKLRVDVPAAENPAKRYAGQLMGRWVTIFGAGIMAPVARAQDTDQ